MNNYLYTLFCKLQKIGMLFICGFGSLGADDVIRLSFVDTATVNDTVIYLKDIADITGGNEREKGRISQIIVGHSAPPGYSRFINTSEIVSLHLDNNSMPGVVLQKKPGRILAKTAFIEKKVGDYKELIFNYLQNNIAWLQGDWTFVIENDQYSFKMFNAPITVTLQGVTEKYPRGLLRLQLIAKQYNKQVSIPLSCRLFVVTQVVCAKCDIVRDKIITLSDCKTVKKDISTFGPKPCLSLSEVVGKKASRTIAGEKIITGNMLLIPPDIIKGDNLSLIISKGNVTISVSAIARENGRIGEKIWVENGSTKKLLRVFVTDKNSVSLL
jgi:flagella basal body P-ring formation protein FlgA